MTVNQQRGAVRKDERTIRWMSLIAKRKYLEIMEWHHHQTVPGFVWCFAWPRLPASPTIKQPGRECAPVELQSVRTTGARQQPLFTSLLDNARRAPLVALRRTSSPSALWTFARFSILITSNHKDAFSAHQPPTADLLSGQGTIREKESHRTASSHRAHQQIRRRERGVR